MKNKILFLIIFAIVGFIFLQIPVNYLVGSKVKLTLFDLFAPVSGAFVGTGFGVIAVFVIQIVNLATHGFVNIESASLIRLFPTLFAVWYFSRKSKWQLLIPLLAMASFNLNPVGRSVWFYSLFWLIPLFTYPFRDRFLVLRSLGSTFTAHAVGGAVWIWAFHLPAAVWVGLIPVVILERCIFALGISATYILTNNLLAIFSRSKLLAHGFSFDKNYLIKFLK